MPDNFGIQIHGEPEGSLLQGLAQGIYGFGWWCSVLSADKAFCRCCQFRFVAGAMSKRKSGQGASGKSAKAAKPEPISARYELEKVVTVFLKSLPFIFQKLFPRSSS